LAGAAALLSTFGLIPAGGGKLKEKALYRPEGSTRAPVQPAGSPSDDMAALLGAATNPEALRKITEAIINRGAI
jgi:hypothetical protein